MLSRDMSSMKSQIKPYTLVWAIALSLLPVSTGLPARADTVEARCDVYPRGEDRATSWGLCTFSQRQGVVGIQLQDGRRCDLTPVGDQPSTYVDQNGRPAYREDGGLGDAGQIYRMATESIFVYWSTAGANAPATPTRTSYGTLRAASPNAQINVRSEPTIRAASPHYGIVGDRVEILECVLDRDMPGSDLNWCNVRFPRSGAIGWIRSDFIIFEDGGE